MEDLSVESKYFTSPKAWESIKEACWEQLETNNIITLLDMSKETFHKLADVFIAQ